MPEYSSPERLVQAVLLPWVEEMQTKFAHHDALRQAEEVVVALRAAGYMRPAPPTAEDALADLVEAVEEARTAVDAAATDEERTRRGIELHIRLMRFKENDARTPEMTEYVRQQLRFLLTEVFQMPDDIVARHTNKDAF